MTYIDAFVAAVPTTNKEEYKEFAERSWEVFRDFGALSMQDCWGEEVPDGETTSFPMAVWQRRGETVVVSWVEWPDKARRDACYTAMCRDPRFAALTRRAMPFDGARMICGGFEPLHPLWRAAPRPANEALTSDTKRARTAAGPLG